jgi:hypothetical protein
MEHKRNSNEQIGRAPRVEATIGTEAEEDVCLG